MTKAQGELVIRTESLFRKLTIDKALEGSCYVMELNGTDVVFTSQLSALNLYLRNETRAAIINALNFTLAQILVPRKLHGFQVTAVAADILAAYPLLRLEEILYCFREAMRGSWNPEGFFGCVDAPTVHNWIKSYAALVRDPIIERNAEAAHESNKGKRIAPIDREKLAAEYNRSSLGLTWDEYDVYLELLPAHEPALAVMVGVMKQEETELKVRQQARLDLQQLKADIATEARKLHATRTEQAAAAARAAELAPRIAAAQAKLPDLSKEELLTYAAGYEHRKEPELAVLFTEELKRRSTKKPRS